MHRGGLIFDIINEYGTSNTHNIAILCFYKKNVQKYHEILQKRDIAHTYYHSTNSVDMALAPDISTLHITTFHSSKGLEFDTVVIPDFEEYEKYFTDFKKTTKEQQKALYVAITRAKKNLYFISNKEISFLKDADTYEVIRQNNADIDDEILF